MLRRVAGPYSPVKIPWQTLRKMFQRLLRRMFRHRIGSCKSADKSGPPATHGQRYARKTSENKSGERKAHAHNVRPCKMPAHRIRPGKIPKGRRSCRVSARATRLGARHDEYDDVVVDIGVQWIFLVLLMHTLCTCSLLIF
jgi:hypothetical protein